MVKNYQLPEQWRREAKVTPGLTKAGAPLHPCVQSLCPVSTRPKRKSKADARDKAKVKDKSQRRSIRTPTSERGLIFHACPYSWACALSALGSHIMFPCIWELLFYHSLFVLFNKCLNHCVFCLLIGLWMMQSQSMFAVVQKENAISILYRTVSWPTAHCHVY